MREPRGYEHAFYMSKGDLEVLFRALGTFLLREDISTLEREQAGDMNERFHQLIHETDKGNSQ